MVCGRAALYLLVSQVSSYGAATSAGPTGSPSTRNCNRVRGTSSSATAESVTWPVTTLDSSGAVNVTDGGTCCTYTERGDLAPEMPLLHACGNAASAVWALERLLPPILAWRRFKLPAPLG